MVPPNSNGLDLAFFSVFCFHFFCGQNTAMALPCGLPLYIQLTPNSYGLGLWESQQRVNDVTIDEVDWLWLQHLGWPIFAGSGPKVVPLARNSFLLNTIDDRVAVNKTLWPLRRQNWCHFLKGWYPNDSNSECRINCSLEKYLQTPFTLKATQGKHVLV